MQQIRHAEQKKNGPDREGQTERKGGLWWLRLQRSWISLVVVAVMLWLRSDRASRPQVPV